MPDRLTIRTVCDFHDERYVVGAWCTPCSRMAKVDLEALIAAGRGDAVLGRLKMTCKKCGAVGQRYIWPPEKSGERTRVAFSH